MSADEEFIGIYDVLDALKDVIVSSDPTNREKLAKAIDGWAESFPEDFHWPTGVQSQMLLYHLLMDIDIACREKDSNRVLSFAWLIERPKAMRSVPR